MSLPSFNRDNLLFTLLGFLLGFVGAYLMFEAVAIRQPQRRVAGDAAADSAALSGNPAGGSAPGANDSGAGAGAGEAAAPMKEILELREHVAKNPKDAAAVRRLGNLNFEIRSWQRAQDLYLQYLQLEKPDPDLLSDLGITYRELGQPERALETFISAEKLAPNHWQSKFNQVVVLAFDFGRFDEAEKLLDEIRKMAPNEPDIDRLAQEVARRRKAAA